MPKNELPITPKTSTNKVEPKKISGELVTNVFSSACAVFGTLIVESLTKALEKKYLK